MATRIISNNAKNDGQRWNIGKQGSFGGAWKNASGLTLSAWVNMADTTVLPIMMCFSTGAEGVSGAGNQFQWWMLNTTWTTDYANLANHVMVQFSDSGDSGFFHGHKGITLSTSTWMHHALTLDLHGTGAGPTPPHNVVWYVNGIASSGAWTEVFGEVAVGNIFNYVNDLYIGAHRKNAGAIVDYSDFDGEDFRVYTRALSAAEIRQLYLQRGRDNIRNGLISRYPFFNDGKNIGPNGIAAIAEKSASGTNGLPLVLNSKLLSATRKRIL